MTAIAKKVFTEEEVKEFAERVERLCDYLITQAKHSKDRDVLADLKEDAASMQFAEITAVDIVISGIAEALA